MRIFCILFFIVFFSTCVKTQSEAAFVHYTDQNGNVVYVNTDYAKVPRQYLSQVQDQLKAIELKKQNPAVNPQTLPTITELTADVSKTGLITKENRLARLSAVIDNLKTMLPATGNVTYPWITYMDHQNQTHLVTPENLTSVPEEFLSAIDSQIISIENQLFDRAQKQISTSPKTPVEVYIKADCIDCTRLQTLLLAHKISYWAYDIKNSPQGVEFYSKMANAQLPITRIGTKIIYGNSINEILAILSAPTNVEPPTSP